jgi:hypothetical protein
MGDKSPKSNERKKKQDAVHKTQVRNAAIAKATPPSAQPLKNKGK